MFISFSLPLSLGFSLWCSLCVSLFPQFLVISISQGSLSLGLSLGIALFIPVTFPQPPFWRCFLWPCYVFVSLWVSFVCMSSPRDAAMSQAGVWEKGG